MTNEILERKGKPRHVSQELRKWIHNFILDNAEVLHEYRL
jgi:hypothetical protein